MKEKKPIRKIRKMCVKFLIKGEKGKIDFDALSVPDGSNAPFNKPIEKSVEQFSNWDDMYIGSISIDSDSIDAAKTLSEIRENVLDECSDFVLMLEDGPSEKFDRVLFELIASFERRFRELLIVGVCNEKGSLDDDLIHKLEEKTLGELFEIVFTDQEFNNKVKIVVNDKKSRRFEKKGLAKTIEQMEENSFWSRYFSDDRLSTVAEEHEFIRSYRNDVMHAHRMLYRDYRYARTLVENANKEMEREIYIRSTHVDFESLNKALSGFAESISKMMAQIDLSGTISSLQQILQTYSTNFSSAACQYSNLHKALYNTSITTGIASSIDYDNLYRNVVAPGMNVANFVDIEDNIFSESAQVDMDNHSSIADEGEQSEGENSENDDERPHSD